MNNVEILQNLSLICIIIAVILFLTAVVLFFVFHIPKLFNELTGRDAQKFIAEAQKKNTEEIPEEKAYGTSESLLSSELISSSLTGTQQKLATTKLSPESAALKSITKKQKSEQSKPVSEKLTETEFSIIEELSFTSSQEIIQ